MSDSYGWVIPIAMCLCGVLFIFGVGGGIVFALYRSGRAVNRGWGDLGARLGLTFKGAGIFAQPELNGDFRSRPIRLYTYDAGSQGHRDTCTAVALTINNANNSKMEITPSGTVGNFLGRMVKAQDVEIGNAGFDPRFVIKSSPPDFAVKVLSDSPVQTAILGIPGRFRIELEGSSLTYSKGGLEENADFLEKVFNTLSDLADRIEHLR